MNKNKDACMKEIAEHAKRTEELLKKQERLHALDQLLIERDMHLQHQIFHQQKERSPR